MTDILIYGLGYIGKEIAKLALEKRLNVIAAVDKADDKANKDLGEIIGTGKLDINVYRTFGDALANSNRKKLLWLKKSKRIALHATSSYLKEIKLELEELIKSGFNVISTAEELVYPYYKHSILAEELDALAKQYNVTILGAGVNPGFVMDYLPIVLGNICTDIQKVYVNRVVDASKRREQLQKKIGICLSLEEFEKLKSELKKEGKRIGHIGLLESAAMIADTLNLKLDKTIEHVWPVISKKEFKRDGLIIKPGYVCGLSHGIVGFKGNNPIIELMLRMYAGACDEDFIRIEQGGKPPILVKFGGAPTGDGDSVGSIHGDMATPAIVVNYINRVLKAKPGLKTVLDLPLMYPSKK